MRGETELASVSELVTLPQEDVLRKLGTTE